MVSVYVESKNHVSGAISRGQERVLRKNVVVIPVAVGGSCGSS